MKLQKIRYLLSLFIPNKTGLLSFISGAVTVFAFSPFNFYALAIINLSILFWLWSKSKSYIESFKIGLLFGLGLFGLGVSWIFSSIYFYSDVILPVAILLTFIFITFLSLYFAFAGYIFKLVSRKSNIFLSLVVMYPAVWVLFELLRTNLFGGLPFLIIGNSALGTWLDGYAPVFGVLGVSWVIAISSGITVWLLLTKRWLIGILLIASFWLTGFYLQKLTWVVPTGQVVKVALVQGNVPQDKKWLSTEALPALMKHISYSLQSQDADIIVWPETAIPGILSVFKDTFLVPLIEHLKSGKQELITGVITEDKDKNYYNSIVNLKDTSMVYRKHHLVLFGEFFPFADSLRWLLGVFNIPFSQFSKGDSDFKTMRLAGSNVGLSICFEASFANELASYIPKAEMMITISNDAWFVHTLEPLNQLQEVQMTALTLGREFARATNTGFSAIIDIKGKIKKTIPAYKEGVLYGTIRAYKGATPFAKWTNKPIIYFLVSIFFGYFLYVLYRNKSITKIKIIKTM